MRLPAALRDAGRHERVVLGAAMAVSFALVVVYVLASRTHGLAGDEVEYDIQGKFFAEGKLWWSTVLTNEPHPTAWKAPGYPAWVGFWYALVGTEWTRVAVVQAFIAPLTVFLTWMLARRLFGVGIALVSACVVAVFPLVWEYFGLLFPEALAIPLTLAVLIAVIDREPTPARVAVVGLLVGANLLVRPTAFFLMAAVAVAWIVSVGWRRGALLTAAAGLIAVLVVLPWTVRNLVVMDGFIPISVQDAAAYGTFNDEAANDSENPYAWRATPAGLDEVIDVDDPDLGEAEFRSELQSLGQEYVLDHPSSVPKAFFWNGITRFWDLRSPSKALAEVDFQGRSRAVRALGLGIYYTLLPLAVLGLWRLRSRREVAYPLLALVVAAMLAFTIIAGTRYRAPIEPLVVILAVVAVMMPGPGLATRLRTR